MHVLNVPLRSDVDYSYLFFVAIIPPKPVQEEVVDMKIKIREEYGCKHALKSPPHVTLLSPFKMSSHRTDDLLNVLKEEVEEQEAFRVGLDGFGHFTDRVIFVDVEQTEPMDALYFRLNERMKKESEWTNFQYESRPFHPHVTLAFRDMNPDQFQQIWPEFKEKKYQASFEADSLFLLKHNGKEWTVLKEIGFGKKGR